MSNRRQRMKPAITLELAIDGLSHDGRGLASRDGKRVFVEGALAGEKVLAEIHRYHSRYEEARTLEIRQSSADRVEPGCRHASLCGGCSLQHLSSDAQVAMKQNTLLEQLRHFGSIQPDRVLPPLRGPVYGYRRKARLGVRFVMKRNEVLVGFREKASNFITDIQQCEVLDPRVGQLIMPLRELIAGLQAAKTIPQIEVAMGDSQVALVFRHMEPLASDDQQALVTFCQQHQLELYLQPGKPH